VGIQAHVAAVTGENEAVAARFGKRSLMRLYDQGLFASNLYLVHVGFPDDNEIALMKQHDCKVVHCPTASMLGAYGVIANRMIPRMVQAGITMSLGTDSATAGGHLDMIRVMYAGACAHKDAYSDATVMGAYKALEMATIEGARACLWDDEIGSLEPGKRADLVLVDRSGLHWHPARSPIANLVYSATGSDVHTVIIDGRVVMQDRVVLTVDLGHLKDELAAASRAWRGRSGVEVPVPWPIH
jgi:cytosine/adenosine deaminase-related metal-dependent hydrolase